MANNKPKLSFAGSFSILTPGLGDRILVDGSGAVPVRVQNLDEGNVAFQATISDLGGSGSVPGGIAVPLNQEGSTNIYSAPVQAGVVPATEPGSNNKVVFVQAFAAGSGSSASMENDSDENPFKAWSGGSGSGSYSAATVYARAPGAPVPVAVQVRPTSAPPAGTAGGGQMPTALYHSRLPGDDSYWLSEPIDLGRTGAPPAFWVLRQFGPASWGLALRCGPDDLVSYRGPPAPGPGGPFPLALRRDGAAGAWPDDVLVSPVA